jgi:hypothetical protein
MDERSIPYILSISAGQRVLDAFISQTFLQDEVFQREPLPIGFPTARVSRIGLTHPTALYITQNPHKI